MKPRLEAASMCPARQQPVFTYSYICSYIIWPVRVHHTCGLVVEGGRGGMGLYGQASNQKTFHVF